MSEQREVQFDLNDNETITLSFHGGWTEETGSVDDNRMSVDVSSFTYSGFLLAEELRRIADELDRVERDFYKELQVADTNFLVQ